MDNITAPTIIRSIDKDMGWGQKLTVTCQELGTQKIPDTSNISIAKEVYQGKQISLESLIGKEIMATFQASAPKQNLDKATKAKTDKTPDELELTWNWWWKMTSFSIPEVTKEVTPTPSVIPSSTKFEITSSQKYTQLCTNARTALMQSMSKHIENGQFIDTNFDSLFEDSDLIFEYLNQKMQIDTPKSMVEMLEAEGATIQEIKNKSTWAIPETISDGVEFKKACEENNLQQDWVISQFNKMNIAKSSDYVQQELGSYKDLLVELLQLKDNESV